MRTFSFVTIFSIEKCSVRLGAFGAKLRRVRRAGESSGLQWGLTIIIIHQKIAKFYVFSNEKLRGPMCFLSGGFCRIYFYVYFFHSDRLLSLQADWLKIHIKVSVSAFVRSRARPSSGLSENQNGFIIFTIQIVIQIRKFANMQIQIHKYKYKYNMIHNHCQNTEL